MYLYLYLHFSLQYLFVFLFLFVFSQTPVGPYSYPTDGSKFFPCSVYLFLYLYLVKHQLAHIAIPQMDPNFYLQHVIVYSLQHLFVFLSVFSQMPAGPYSYPTDGSKIILPTCISVYPMVLMFRLFSLFDLRFFIHFVHTQSQVRLIFCKNLIWHFWVWVEQQNDGCHPSEWGETLLLEFLACLYARVLKSPFWAITHPSCAIFGHTHTPYPHTLLTLHVLRWYTPVPSCPQSFAHFLISYSNKDL